jgi:hypothetical protein
MSSRFLLPIVALPVVCSQRVFSGAYNVAWSTPSNETEGPFFRGTMPIGNGDTQVGAWANVSSGGVSFYIAKQDAMHSDTSQYKIALLTVAVSPNPYLTGQYFNQTLDLTAARVVIEAGGTSHDTASVLLSVWVDAHSNTVYATAVAGPGGPGTPFSLIVDLTPVRPEGYARYVPDWHCTAGSSAPDVVVAPVSAEAGFGGWLVFPHSVSKNSLSAA